MVLGHRPRYTDIHLKELMPMREPDYSILAKLRLPTKKATPRKNLTGQIFCRLTVYGLVGYHKNREVGYWLCRCSCGNFRLVSAAKLKYGFIKSCGCWINQHRGASSRTHGMTGSRVYNIWNGMISRCHNPNDGNYPNWGGRGIIVCDHWRFSFESFFADMGHPPTDEHQIDRIDVNGNYQADNCRWATHLEQMRNTRRNHRLTVGEQTYCIGQWAEITGINPLLIGRRIRRGWTPEEALEFKER